MLDLKRQTPTVAKVDITKWNDEVDGYVKRLNLIELAIVSELLNEASDKTKDTRTRAEIYARVATIALVDKDGNPLLTEEDIPAILEGSSGPIVSIFFGIPMAGEAFKKK